MRARRAVQRAAPPPSSQLLQSLFLGLPGLPDVPQLRYTACLLVGAYASWLGEAARAGGPPQLVAGSLRLLLAGASPPVSFRRARVLAPAPAQAGVLALALSQACGSNTALPRARSACCSASPGPGACSGMFPCTGSCEEPVLWWPGRGVRHALAGGSGAPLGGLCWPGQLTGIAHLSVQP